jgi:aspartyl-tRNA(Asn)/glutamyl-tRNA(Gln) amidotransferase subunit A
MTNANEICRMDATSLSAAIRGKALSPVEVVDATLERMDALDPTLHAFCTPTPELARESAQRVEKAIVAGEEVGPLAGVPYGCKDLICTAGVRTVSGSAAYADFVPDEDDVVVERMREADAVMLGKTNVPEFGYSGAGHNSVFETTRNPWNVERTAGGSSVGSGAAVASGIGPVALGSDGGGSVRIPASFSGLVGVKASMGRVPLYPGVKDERYPGVSSWEALEHIGPITRTVADAALLLSVIAGPDDRDTRTVPVEAGFDWLDSLKGDLKGLRVAYTLDWGGYAAVDPQVRTVVTEAVKAFESDLGCIVEEAHPGWDNPYDGFWGMVAGQSDLKGLRRMATELGDEMTPHLKEFIETDWTAEELTDAVMMRKHVSNMMWRFMRNYDLLLTPTLTVPAFEVGIQGPTMTDGREVHEFEWLHFTYPMNLTGQPAASVPAGFTDDGLPVGLQIVGPHLGDSIVLRAAACFEAARPWADKWPPLLDEMGL